MARPEKVRLGEILVQQKLLTAEQLKLALDEQKRSGRKLGRVFIEQGYVTEEGISRAAPVQPRIGRGAASSQRRDTQAGQRAGAQGDVARVR